MSICTTGSCTRTESAARTPALHWDKALGRKLTQRVPGVLWRPRVSRATCYDERLAVQRDAKAAADGGVHIRQDRHAVKLDGSGGARQSLQSWTRCLACSEVPRAAQCSGQDRCWMQSGMQRRMVVAGSCGKQPWMLTHPGTQVPLTSLNARAPLQLACRTCNSTHCLLLWLWLC